MEFRIDSDRMQGLQGFGFIWSRIGHCERDLSEFAPSVENVVLGEERMRCASLVFLAEKMVARRGFCPCLVIVILEQKPFKV